MQRDDDDVVHDAKKSNEHSADRPPSQEHGPAAEAVAAIKDLRDSFKNAASRLEALIDGQHYGNRALHHQTVQAETMICALEHISRNTCEILNEEHRQTGLLGGIRADTAD